jgi:hypothetical protein
MMVYHVIFSVAAFIFYVIAASGYSIDYKVLKGLVLLSSNFGISL